MILMSALLSIFFLGGWLPLFYFFPFYYVSSEFWFSLKIILGVLFFIICRAALPRYRYDQLMYLGWKCFLPLSISYLILTASILITFNLL